MEHHSKDLDSIAEALIDLQQMAGAVVAAHRLGDPALLSGAVQALANTLKASGVTGLGNPAPQWPPPVGTVFTWTDDDGAVWPGCVVRPSDGGPEGGWVWFDNGDAGDTDCSTNGATVYGWAAEDEVTYG